MVAPVLLGLGIRELSMSAVSIPEVKAMIRKISIAEVEVLAKKMLKLPTAADVKAMVTAYLADLDKSGAP